MESYLVILLLLLLAKRKLDWLLLCHAFKIKLRATFCVELAYSKPRTNGRGTIGNLRFFVL